jgi:hypothetical protein
VPSVAEGLIPLIGTRFEAMMRMSSNLGQNRPTIPGIQQTRKKRKEKQESIQTAGAYARLTAEHPSSGNPRLSRKSHAHRTSFVELRPQPPARRTQVSNMIRCRLARLTVARTFEPRPAQRDADVGSVSTRSERVPKHAGSALVWRWRKFGG